MTALRKAYASNAESPILALKITHDGLDDILVYRGYGSDMFTLEGIYGAAAIEIKLPDKNTEGDQSLNFTVGNVDNKIMADLMKVVAYNRGTSDKKVRCILRRYLPSERWAGIGAYPTFVGDEYSLIITEASVNRVAASFSAKYSPLPDVTFPRRRYYTDKFPGLTYVR